MPLGTSAQSVRNLPTEPYVVDDNAWRLSAKKNVSQVATAPWNATGTAIPFTLPQAGIVGGILIQFDGTVTSAAGTAVPGDRWPYGLISSFTLAVNGQQDLFSCFGEDLRVLEDISFPAYTESTDVFPGSIMGGSAITTGAHTLSLAWWVPISTELVTLTGALYAQTPSTSIQCVITPATNAQLFSSNPTDATIAGSFTIQETFFVPAYDTQGRIIVPSGIAYLHSLSSVDLPLTNAGSSNRVPLIRGSGNLQRLLMGFRASPTSRLSAAPSAAAASKIDELHLSYGANQVPYEFNPASLLARINNRDYGFPAPYDYLVLDTLKQDPQRDAIVFAGLTELALFVTPDSAVTLSGGTAHVVEETVFQ